jgi:glycerate 2-kinase
MTDATSYSAADRRRHADAILRAAIAAADPARLVQRALHGAVELEAAPQVRIIAIGKAAPGMAAAAGEILGERVRDTLVIAPHGTPSPPGTLFGAHPAPDEGSLAAGRAVLERLRGTPDQQTVLVLLSGGASASVAVPLGDISIAEYAECAMKLMRAGADIRDLNIVRKHIDALKGGRMALHAAPAAVLGLVLSDVVGDPVDIIASGPLTPDPTSCDDALHVLRRHGLLDECAPSIRRYLEECAEPAPAEGHAAFANVRVRVIGGNDVAIEGAASHAETLGYRVRRATDPVTGPAREAGATLAREARLLQRAGDLPVCIIAGGETTVAVAGTGRGGRNQELVLAACIDLDGHDGITVASAGTDGIDGNTEAAGAIADEHTLQLAAQHDVHIRAILDDNDSHAFFTATDCLVVTGPTGTNVNDVHVALIAQPAGFLPPLPL